MVSKTLATNKKKGILGVPIPVLVIFIIIVLALSGVGLVGGALGLGFLGVHEPHIALPTEVVFHIGPFPITNTVFTSWITMLVLVVGCWAITRKMKMVPGRLQGAFEFLLGWLYDFCVNVAGEKNGRKFFPLITTIFLYVAFNAWLALIPIWGTITLTNHEGEIIHLLRAPNTDVNLPLAIAIVSFIVVEVYGFKASGIKYLAKFFNVGPLFKAIGDVFTGKLKSGLSGLFFGVIYLVVGLLEGLSELIRLVSFTFRLFGNMTAGEILLLIITFLVPWGFATIFYGLELLVGAVQGLIFAGLTLVFITLAMAHHGEEEHS